MNCKIRKVLKRMVVFVLPVLLLGFYLVPCFAADEEITTEITDEVREEVTEETEQEISKERVKTWDSSPAVQCLVITVITGIGMLYIRKKIKVME